MKVEDWEELSAKVKSDLIQLHNLDAEVNRLKKLEEANSRLRKYNGELRHALIMAQEADSSGRNHPAIQIPEREGQDELFTNESVDVGQNWSSEEVALNSLLVLDVIFKMMDLKDVKNCRLVCKKWNEGAFLILFKPNKGLPVQLHLGNRIRDPYEFVARIKALPSIVVNAPEDWFRRAFVDRRFLQRAEIQSIMQDFDYRLRTIKTTGPTLTFLFQDIRNILVDWCPNLERLSFSSLTVEDGEDILESGYQKLTFPQPLKLTELCLGTTFCVEIIKSSPKLKILTCVRDTDNFQFFKKLSTCPEITKNLEEMTLYFQVQANEDNEVMRDFKSIKFSHKLKTLSLLCWCKGVFQIKDLSEILEQVGETLEKLIFTITKFQPISNPSTLTFPVMNNLKELRYLANRGLPINSIEFLADIPNLQVLYLSEDYDYPTSSETEEFIDNFFLISNCQELRRNPHKNLKELYLFGIVNHPTRTFQMMNQIFPNMTKLVVGLFKCNLLFNKSELKEYYEEAFQGVSEICNLKKLYLDFRNTVQEPTFGDGMSFPFDHLGTLSNLDHLTIRNEAKTVTFLDVNMTEKLLMELKNLRRVTLIGISLDLMTVKELAELLDKHDIQLEIKDEGVKEDFRVHVKKDFGM